jgi:hypothetical protein
MTTRSRGARTLSGAFVSVDPTNPTPNLVAFAYNPATLKRSLQPQQVGGEEGDRSEAVRFTGPPVQTISIEIAIDATDQLGAGNAAALSSGALPDLARLELLVYPTLAQVNQIQAQLDSGTMEITPMTAPRTLFVWGAKRVLPVRITSMEITEELFDTQLNPIRATVAITMRVLTYTDLASTNREYYEFMSYQQNLINLAASGQGARPPVGTAPEAM